jgi:N-acetylmuramoyl-L-alanine amidase
MPGIYLSPSVQESSPYIIGGSEEYYMNLIADAIIPYLRACGIRFARNNPGNTLSQVISQSNSEIFDLHLALRSGTSPEPLSGVLQGPDVYFFPAGTQGPQAAAIFAENLRKIYPNPELVTVIPSTVLAELRRTNAPSILVELAYHDNETDAAWIKENINPIAKNLARSVAEYLKVPFVD